MSAPASEDDALPPIAHEDFRAGVPHGHFRIVVNPTLARAYLVQRSRSNLVVLPLIAIGAALALAGKAIAGVLLVALGIGLNRLVRSQAGRIVLYLATRDRADYDEVTHNGVMEVRRSA